MNKLFPILLILLLNSCEFWSESKDEDPIAKANGNFLYASDLMSLQWSSKDTVVWNERQVEEWIKRELWFAQATKNGINLEIREKLEDYKKSLVIAAYKQNILDQTNMLISEDMIQSYYQANLTDYELTEDLFKLEYYILPNDDKAEEVRALLNQNLKVDYLTSYCQDHTEWCLSNGPWVASQVLQDLGLPEYLWLSSSKFQQYYREDNYVCIYRIEAKRKSGEATPIDQVRTEIVEILKFQQENEILKNKEVELFLNAQNQKNFEIYN